MNVKFNQSHANGLMQDTIIKLNSKYSKVGESEFEVNSNEFSGKFILEMAKDGVELTNGVITFLKAAKGFLDTIYFTNVNSDDTISEYTFRDYLAQHLTVETDEYELVLLQANGAHFTGTQIVEFSKYGEILNLDEYNMLINNEDFTIEKLDNEWFKYFTDFKQAREKMKLLSNVGPTDDFTADEVKILAKWFVLPTSEILTILTEEEYDAASDRFNELSIRSRITRFRKLTRYIRKTLGVELAKSIMTDITTNKLDLMYKEYGLEGTMKVSYEGVTDDYGLFDYIINHTEVTDDIKNTVMEILDKGNY
jgi:hypothetical protein